MNFQNCAIYCYECDEYIYDLEFERIYRSEEEKFYQLLLQSESNYSSCYIYYIYLFLFLFFIFYFFFFFFFFFFFLVYIYIYIYI